jgi:hypothetical protein
MTDATTPDDLPDDQVADLVDLALGTQAGEAFTLGGREFTRTWLMVDSEQDLQAILVELIKRAPTLDLADLMITSSRELLTATALIIADYDHPGADPEAIKKHRAEALAWLRTTRGITTHQLLDVVLAQVSLNQLGVLLGKLSTVVGPLAATAVRHHPPT